MESIDDVVKHLQVIMPEAEFHCGSGKTVEIIEFIESLKGHVVFCKKCEKLRPDPGVEMKINDKPIPMCEPCLDDFLGKVSPHAEEVEYEIDDGTKLTTQPGGSMMTISEPDPDPHSAAMMRPDKDYEEHDHWAVSRERARKEGVDDQVFSNDGEGPPK